MTRYDMMMRSGFNSMEEFDEAQRREEERVQRILSEENKRELEQTTHKVEVPPVDEDYGHIVYIGRKAYYAENTIMELMRKMDIIRDSLAHIENYFDTNAEIIQQIYACFGRCTDIAEVKYFINRIKENSRYD